MPGPVRVITTHRNLFPDPQFAVRADGTRQAFDDILARELASIGRLIRPRVIQGMETRQVSDDSRSDSIRQRIAAHDCAQR